MADIVVLKSNREKKQDLVAASRAERGIARHLLVGPATFIQPMVL
jgi:hypothetical protein